MQPSFCKLNIYTWEKKQQTILSTSINHEMLFTSPPHFSRCHSTVPRYIYHAADMSIWWKFNKNGSLHLKEICIYLASPLNFPHAQNTFVTLHNFAPKLALLLVPLDITRCKLSYDMRVFLQYNEMSSRHFTLLFVDIIPSVNITSPNVCRLPRIFPPAVVLRLPGSRGEFIRTLKRQDSGSRAAWDSGAMAYTDRKSFKVRLNRSALHDIRLFQNILLYLYFWELYYFFDMSSREFECASLTDHRTNQTAFMIYLDTAPIILTDE